MADGTAYAFIRIKGTGRNWQPIHDRLAETDFDAVSPASVWGCFHGLFGIASNELVIVTSGTPDSVARSVEGLANAPDISIVDSLLLEPTVRPTRDDARTREGLYVFRFFDVRNADVDEVARLSNEAWTTFENTEDYDAVPQGLWCQLDRAQEHGKMLLLTWYGGLDSWQTSRQPAPAARENFQQRHLLTQGTIAYATRLITR